MFTELVMAIGLVVAGLNKAGKLWSGMLLKVVMEVSSMMKGCWTAYVSAGNAVAPECVLAALGTICVAGGEGLVKAVPLRWAIIPDESVISGVGSALNVKPSRPQEPLMVSLGLMPNTSGGTLN
jgi:hypothetical protein